MCISVNINLAASRIFLHTGYVGSISGKCFSPWPVRTYTERRKLQETKERLRITCSKDIYDIFQPIMCDLEQEEFWVLLLNQATKLIDKVRISTGGIDGTYTDVRTILREALLQRATQIAVVHNHPSGNIHPSQPDRSLTEHIHKAAETMNIRLIDHVIVCEDGFFSFADEGLL